MISVCRAWGQMQYTAWLVGLGLFSASVLMAEDKAPSVPANPAAEAKAEGEMKPYTEKIHGTDAKFDLVPIKGGEYVIGSPEKEAGRSADEGPQRKVKIAPFWMGKCEVTWDEYDIWNHNLDIKKRSRTWPRTPSRVRPSPIPT